MKQYHKNELASHNDLKGGGGLKVFLVSFRAAETNRYISHEWDLIVEGALWSVPSTGALLKYLISAHVFKRIVAGFIS